MKGKMHSRIDKRANKLAIPKDDAPWWRGRLGLHIASAPNALFKVREV